MGDQAQAEDEAQAEDQVQAGGQAQVGGQAPAEQPLHKPAGSWAEESLEAGGLESRAAAHQDKVDKKEGKMVVAHMRPEVHMKTKVAVEAGKEPVHTGHKSERAVEG